MLWMPLTALPSFMYAITNHMDKHLLDKHFQGNLGVMALVVVSALVSVIAIPFLVLWSPDSLIPELWWHISLFAVVGLLHVALVAFYLIALQEEDTTTVIVFYSILPILGLVFANIFLGEVLVKGQLYAMAAIIVGILVISFERNEKKKIRFKGKAAGFMFLASLCWAVGDVVFKAAAIEENIWQALFWEHVVMFFVGLVMLVFAHKTRAQMKAVLHQNTKKILAINFTSEALYVAANVIGAFPLLMVQVAAVQMVQSMQPVWVFLIALGLMTFGLTKERFTLEQFIQKSFATSIAVYGMYLLAVHTPV